MAAAETPAPALRDSVNGWLATLGARIGAPLSLDGAGACSLRTREGTECNVEVAEGDARLYFHSPLVRVGDSGAARAFEEALALSLFGRRLGGGCIGLDRDSRWLVYAQSHDTAAWGPVEFAGALMEFARHAQFLRGELAAAQAQVPSPAAGADPVDIRFIV